MSEHAFPSRKSRVSKTPSSTLDLRAQVPDLVPYLRPGERVVNVETFTDETPRKPPSSLQEMYRLTQAWHHGEIGELGPVAASRALEAHADTVQYRRYETLFGRDSLRAALDLVDYYPKLARTTLVALAELQGIEVNAEREEEPGRIIHEARDATADPIARQLTRERGWGWPYYGSVDATLEFIRTMSAYVRSPHGGITVLQTPYAGRDGHSHTLADAVVAATNWMTGRLDANAEGLLEFQRMTPGGIENQVWKDSPDSYFHADGTLANHERGIASVEIQRLAYEALLDAAELYENPLGRAAEAKDLRKRAERMRTIIIDRFWTEDRGGYFMMGTDRDGRGRLRDLAVRTSNMGHVLHSRLLQGDDPEIVRRREAVVWQLFSPFMLSVSGIRTLAMDEPRFRPGAYHNGSVWLWDNYLIAQGLRQHGYINLAANLEDRIEDVVQVTRRFPEFARGDEGSIPTLNHRIVDITSLDSDHLNRIEQPPQDIQAWTVAAALAIKRARRRARGAAMPDPGTFEHGILSSLT